MINNAWRILAAAGLLAILSAPACVVGSSDDEDGGSGGISGGSGGGGGSGGSGATGGSGGSGGTGATGATGGAGGTGAIGGGGSGGSAGYTCDATGSTAGSCEPEPGSTDPCAACIKQNCCTEWGACIAENPNNPCGWGGPNGDGEIFCMQSCYITETTQNGLDDAAAKNKCGNDCVSSGCGTIAGETNDAFTCLSSSCLTECLSN